MGAKAPAAQTVTQKTELPAWLEDVTKQNLRIADEIASRPYQAYGGNLVAGFAPEQEQAFSMAQRQAGSTMPLYQTAAGTVSGLTGYQAPSFLQGDVSAYMNPFIGEVENRAIARGQEALLQNLNQVSAQAARAGAFGGSRQAIQEGVAQAEAAKNVADLSAQLRMQGYNQAAGLLENDLARQMAGTEVQMRAAGMLPGIAQAQQGAALTDAATIEAIGAQRQALQQAQLQDQYQRFMEERNYPVEMLNLRLGATSATPYGTTQTKTQTGGPSGSNFLSGAGTALTAATTAMKFLPLLFGGSDERMKTDIEKVGKDKETGLTMYAYRYKGDPKSYPKVVGPMAQEVEKKYPEMVEERGGRKTVNLGFGPMRKGMA